MSKTYFNLFHNRAIIINEKDKTFKLIKATDMTKSEGGFFYQSKMARLIEIKNGLLERGFQRA